MVQATVPRIGAVRKPFTFRELEKINVLCALYSSQLSGKPSSSIQGLIDVIIGMDLEAIQRVLENLILQGIVVCDGKLRGVPTYSLKDWVAAESITLRGLS